MKSGCLRWDSEALSLLRWQKTEIHLALIILEIKKNFFSLEENGQNSDYFYGHQELIIFPY